MKFSEILESCDSLNETNLARVFQHVEENCCVCISAERNEITDPKERKEREKSLEIDIKKGDFGFSKVKGSYIETKEDGSKVTVSENTFMVFFKTDRLEFAQLFFENLRKKYNQEAYLLVKDKIAYYCDGKTEFKLGKFSLNSAAECFTKLKNNRSFTFESVEDIDERGLIGLTPTSYQFNKLKLKEIEETLKLQDSEEKSKKLQELINY